MALDSFLCTCCEPTPCVGVANPSSISSEISSDSAGGSKLLVIVYHPGRLACGTPGRLMGRSHAGDLAGVKPWRLLCMNGGLIGWGGKPVVTQGQGEREREALNAFCHFTTAPTSYMCTCKSLRRKKQPSKKKSLRDVNQRLPH